MPYITSNVIVSFLAENVRPVMFYFRNAIFSRFAAVSRQRHSVRATHTEKKLIYWMCFLPGLTSAVQQYLPFWVAATCDHYDIVRRLMKELFDIKR